MFLSKLSQWMDCCPYVPSDIWYMIWYIYPNLICAISKASVTNNTGENKIGMNSHLILPSERARSIAPVSSVIGWCNEQQAPLWTILSMKRLDGIWSSGVHGIMQLQSHDGESLVEDRCRWTQSTSCCDYRRGEWSMFNWVNSLLIAPFISISFLLWQPWSGGLL